MPAFLLPPGQTQSIMNSKAEFYVPRGIIVQMEQRNLKHALQLLLTTSQVLITTYSAVLAEPVPIMTELAKLAVSPVVPMQSLSKEVRLVRAKGVSANIKNMMGVVSVKTIMSMWKMALI